MNTMLDTTAKQVGDEIIALSESRSEKMERWSDVATRPDNLSNTECVGFINKETGEDTPLSIVVDLQVPASKQEAALRIWAIKSSLDENQTERFSNIQLTFTADYSKARLVAEKGAAVTRGDLRAVLHDKSTQLVHVVVSNRSGFDTSSKQGLLGERYDVTMDELGGQDDIASRVNDTLHTVFPMLKS